MGDYRDFGIKTQCENNVKKKSYIFSLSRRGTTKRSLFIRFDGQLYFQNAFCLLRISGLLAPHAYNIIYSTSSLLLHAARLTFGSHLINNIINVRYRGFGKCNAFWSIGLLLGLITAPKHYVDQKCPDLKFLRLVVFLYNWIVIINNFTFCLLLLYY